MRLQQREIEGAFVAGFLYAFQVTGEVLIASDLGRMRAGKLRYVWSLRRKGVLRDRRARSLVSGLSR